MTNNPFVNSESFSDAVVAELKNKSLKTLFTHVRDLAVRSVYAVQRVFVSDYDSASVMKETVADLLISTGESIRDGKISLEFLKNNEGGLTGEFKFEVADGTPLEDVVPEAMINRSAVNQAKKAIKNLTG